MRKIIYLFTLLLTISVVATEIDLNDSRLQWVGRWTKEHQADWSLSELRFKMDGGTFELVFGARKGVHLAIVIDNNQPLVVKPKADGDNTIKLNKKLAKGDHLIRIIRRTESYNGVLHIKKLVINDGQLLEPPAVRKKRILVVGDSISCGYGNECPTIRGSYNPGQQNALKAYGFLLAESAHADCQIVAWSGQGLIRDSRGNSDTTMLDRLDRVLAILPKPTVNLADWQPDLVIFNLGTNDMATGMPSKKEWQAALKKFTAKIRAAAPEAPIILCTGPLLRRNGPKPTTQELYAEYHSDFAKQSGDKNIYAMEYNPLPYPKGYGANHPSAYGQQLMADQLLDFIKKNIE